MVPGGGAATTNPKSYSAQNPVVHTCFTEWGHSISRTAKTHCQFLILHGVRNWRWLDGGVGGGLVPRELKKTTTPSNPNPQHSFVHDGGLCLQIIRRFCLNADASCQDSGLCGRESRGLLSRTAVTDGADRTYMDSSSVYPHAAYFPPKKSELSF